MYLGIYGAGGLGREILFLAQQINAVTNRWDGFLFIDDKAQYAELKNIHVLSFEKSKTEYDKMCIEFVIAVGEPHTRRILREKVSGEGFSLATLIHPSVSVSDGTKVGGGTIICCNCFVSCDVIIGENVLLQPCASIGHDTQISNDSVISTFVCVAGGCLIGEETYIGLHTSIREHINIGAQSIVGMGSVVTKDIPDQVIALGNPARAMKKNEDHKVF